MKVPRRRICHTAVAVVAVLAWICAADLQGQANGKLQIHYMDVGQGDAAVLVSPKGQVVLFDDGRNGHCDKPVAYLEQLGVSQIDYHIASHYHADHIGCAQEVFDAYPLRTQAYDRGPAFTPTPGPDPSKDPYLRYVAKVGGLRKAADTNTVITLDEGSPDPVTISIVALNGDTVSTTNENDRSVVALIQFGRFRAEIGGDLSGYHTGDYDNIETPVAPKVGHIDVYKVHHHGSKYSSNDTWLATTRPRIGIISIGTLANGNTYHHPTAACLARLHKAGVKTYWTEAGEGVAPDARFDVVAGSVSVEVAPAATGYTVTRFNGVTETFPMWATAATPTPIATLAPTPAALTYAWSTKAHFYHISTCRYVQSIAPANLQQGPIPPPGKKLHEGCPQ